jgi:mannose-6-phosphate isomerase-like protein (cupin superfamily)
MTDKSKSENWKFIHSQADKANWKPGLREIFDYRDLGFIEATNGDYIVKTQRDEVQEWHLHECSFQFVLVLNGSATFEYEGEGIRTIQKGDAINQRPWIAHREIECSPDFEVLEIVSPANFKTRIVSTSELGQQSDKQ